MAETMMKVSGSGDRYTVRAVARTLDILDLLQESAEGAPLGTISDRVDLPKSSVFRYLSTLEHRGYVQRDRASGIYRLGMGFWPLHTHHLQVLSARSKPYLEELRDRFAETISLAVLDGNRIAYVEIFESNQAMRLAARVGDRVPVHSSALGKAICATMADRDVAEILEAEGMPKLTANTITDVRTFLLELAEVRRTGRAVDDREHEDDGRCVAVAIADGRVPAAISLSAPAMRFTLEEAGPVADALADTAAAISGTRRDAA